MSRHSETVKTPQQPIPNTHRTQPHNEYGATPAAQPGAPKPAAMLDVEFLLFNFRNKHTPYCSRCSAGTALAMNDGKCCAVKHCQAPAASFSAANMTATHIPGNILRCQARHTIFEQLLSTTPE
jgi:hypothetical protein